MSPRGELALAVGTVLAGGAGAVLGAGRAWLRARVSAGPGLPALALAPTGREVAPGVVALALVALAGVLALAASRGRWRVAVGVVVTSAGAGVTLLAAGAADAETAAAERGGAVLGVTAPTVTGVVATPWPLITAAAGALVAVGGALIAVRGPRWAGLGRRYDAPSAATPSALARPDARPDALPDARPDPGERALWDALDRGEDPTR